MPWQSIALSILGVHWALNFLFPALVYGIGAPLGFIPLFGFAAPFIWRASKGWRRTAFCLCVFEVCLSPLFWVGSMASFMDPLGFRVRLLGIPVLAIWSAGGQFVFFAVRGATFVFAAFLIRTMPTPSTNKPGNA